jgi:hypothetical protein
VRGEPSLGSDLSNLAKLPAHCRFAEQVRQVIGAKDRQNNNCRIWFAGTQRQRGRESFSGNDKPHGRRFFRKRLPTPSVKLDTSLFAGPNAGGTGLRTVNGMHTAGRLRPQRRAIRIVRNGCTSQRRAAGLAGRAGARGAPPAVGARSVLPEAHQRRRVSHRGFGKGLGPRPARGGVDRAERGRPAR